MGPKTRVLVIVAVAVSLGLGGCGPPPDLLTGPDPFDSMRRQENIDAEAAAAHHQKWEEQTQLASVEAIEDLGLEKEQELNYRNKKITREDHAELSKLVETLRSGLDSTALDAEHQLKRLAIEQGLPVADYVVQLVSNRKRHVRMMAIGLVGRFGEKRTFPHLIRRLLDPDLQVRNVAFAGLKRLADRHYGLSPYDYVLGSDGRIQQQGAKLIEQLYAYNPYAPEKERIHMANAWLTWYREDMRGKGLPRRFDDQAPVDVVVTRPKPLDIYMKDPELKVPTVKMFGVRSGSLIFTEFEDADKKLGEEGRLLVGVYYRYPFGATEQLVLEVGVDTGSNTGDVVNEELFIFRTNFLYYPSLPAKWYLSVGGGYAYEISDVIADDETSTFLEAALGFALNLAGQDWDLRSGYWWFQDSKNVEGLVMLSVALRF